MVKNDMGVVSEGDANAGTVAKATKTRKTAMRTMNLAEPVLERFYATLEREKVRTMHVGLVVPAQNFMVDLLNLYDETYPEKKSK